MDSATVAGPAIRTVGGSPDGTDRSSSASSRGRGEVRRDGVAVVRRVVRGARGHMGSLLRRGRPADNGGVTAGARRPDAGGKSNGRQREGARGPLLPPKATAAGERGRAAGDFFSGKRRGLTCGLWRRPAGRLRPG